jgi:hypothetical protein
LNKKLTEKEVPLKSTDRGTYNYVDLGVVAPSIPPPDLKHKIRVSEDALRRPKFPHKAETFFFLSKEMKITVPKGSH